jgi:hypothetical protein
MQVKIEYRVQAEYTTSLVTSAAWRFWRKRRWSDAVLSIALLSAVGYLFLVRGNREWWVGFFMALGLIYVCSTFGVFLAYRRASMNALVAMGDPVATWVFSEDSISSESGLGKAEIPWGKIKEVWCFPDSWLFVYGADNYSTLPIAAVSEDVKSFVLGKVLGARGKVR